MALLYFPIYICPDRHLYTHYTYIYIYIEMFRQNQKNKYINISIYMYVYHSSLCFPYVGLCKLIIRPLPPKWTPLHFLVWVVWQEDVANAPSPATTIPGGTHEALVNLTMCSSIKLFTYHILIAHTDITY